MKSKNFQAWRTDFERRYANLAPARAGASTGTCYITSALDYTRASAQERRVEAVLSSTNPVARWDCDQVLLHSPEAVDLHRLVDGGLPLLFSHDPFQIIGRAENVRVFEGTLRANLRFSNSAKGQEVFQDVLDGVATGISIGFNVTSSEFDEESQVQTITRWTPLEASVVAMPADMTARIERSLELGFYRERPAEVRAINYQLQLLASYTAGIVDLAGPRGISESREYAGAIADIQQRIMDASSESDFESCRELIKKTTFDYLADQDSQTNVRTIRTTDCYGKPFNAGAPGVITSRGISMDNFSLCRALAMQFDPAAARAGGPELEIMQDAARRRGNRSSGEQHTLTLPEEALFTRAVTKGGSGGNLIGTEHMGMMFIPALRERLISGRMGATLLPGLTGDIQIPRGLTDSAAGWIAGDGSDQVGASDPTYNKITMRPKTVGVKSTLSRKMILQGDPASELLLRNTLVFAVAKAIDSAALIGDGTGNKPIGVLETDDIGTDTYTHGGLPTFGDIVDMEGALMVDDADTGNLGYVTTGLLASKLKQTEVVETTGQMIWTSTAEAEGRMNGYRALASNIVPAGYVLFGNWSDLIIGMWSGYDFTVDPYTRAAYGDVVINLLLDCDVAVRHGESFAELHEAAS